MPRPRSFQVYARYIAQPLGVVITAPPDGGTATSAAVEIEWVVGGGIQASYIVRVYADAALTSLVYSSGSVASPTPSHTIPAGVLLSGFTYYVTVEVTFTEAGGTAISEASSFTTAFPASGNVGTVSTRAIGGCTSDQRILPGIRVSWNAPTLGAGETFVQYDVRRRVAGATMWTKVASLTSAAVLSYIDYGVASQEVYEYSVLYQATVAGGIVVSASQVPAPTGWVKFDFAFIHAVGDPATYVRFDGWQVDFDVKMNVQYQEVWGRQAPIAQVGEQDYRTATLQGHPEQLARLRIFPATRALVTAQRALSRVLCLRLGRARDLMYGQINGLKRTGGGGSVGGGGPSKTAYSTLNMTETFFDEAAAAATIQPPVVVPATSGTGELTLTGDLITDAVRLHAEAYSNDPPAFGDGLVSPQSKVGFFGPRVNNFGNGSIETDLSLLTANNCIIALDSTIGIGGKQSKFGESFLLITPVGGGPEVFVSVDGDVGAMRLGMVAGGTYTVSVNAYMPNQAGRNLTDFTIDFFEFFGGTYQLTRSTSFPGGSLTAFDTYQVIFLTVTLNAASTEAFFRIHSSDVDATHPMRVDGIQHEDGPIPTPFVYSDGGPATAVIGAASGPMATLSDATRGWFAARIEMGYGSGDALGFNSPLCVFLTSSTDWFTIYRQDGLGNIVIARNVGGAVDSAIVAAAWNRGDPLTIVGRWTATTLSISVNGGAFVTVASVAIPAEPATFYIGTGPDFFSTWSATGSMYWVAMGTGTLGDTRPATFDSWGNTDRPDPLQYWFAPEEELTVFWPADTAAYRYPIPS